MTSLADKDRLIEELAAKSLASEIFYDPEGRGDFLDFCYIVEPPQRFRELVDRSEVVDSPGIRRGRSAVESGRLGENTPTGKIKLQKWPHVREMADAFNNHSHIVVLKARQLGFSWIAAAYAVWMALFHRNAVVLMLSRGEKEAAALLDKARAIYKNLPDSWKPERQKEDKSSQSEFTINAMESKIVALPSTMDAGRSETASVVIQDEADFHEYLDENYMAIGPTIDMGGQVIMGSTSNKRKMASMLKGFVKEAPGNGWHKLFFGWKARPGRDEKWYADRKANIPQYELDRTGLTPEQYMEQEYPACFHPDTLISTDEGILPIKQSRYAFVSGYGQLWKLRTAAGRELLLTKEHRLAVLDGEGLTYIEAQYLGHGDEILLKHPVFASEYTRVEIPGRFKNESRSILIDEQWGRFLGFFVGDGYIGGRFNGSHSILQSLGIVCDGKDTDIHTLVKEDMRELLGQEPRMRSVSNGGAVELRSGSNKYGEIFKAFGVVRPKSEGNAARKVCVPPAIFRSPKPVVREFLSAVWETDGFVQEGKPRMILYSKHEEFLREVQFLLLGFGITSRIKVADKTATHKGKTHSYVGRELVLRKPEVELFGREIGFLSERKRSRFGTFSTMTTGRAIAKPIRYVDQFVSLEPAFESQVWDVTIPPEHCFPAMGIWAHNSEAQALAPPRTMGYFDHDVLMMLQKETRKPIRQYSVYSQATGGVIGYINIYWHVDLRGRYVAGTDTSHGKRQDYSVTVVYNYAARRVVADIFSNEVEPDEFAQASVQLMRLYNNPLWCIEDNDRGIEVIKAAQKAGYWNLYHRETSSVRGGKRNQVKQPGWHTTDAPDSRPVLWSQLASALRRGDIIVPNEEGLSQFFGIIQNPDKQMRPEAMIGAHDDYPMAVGLAWQMIERKPEYAHSQSANPINQRHEKASMPRMW